jgi:hypothetical protein
MFAVGVNRGKLDTCEAEPTNQGLRYRRFTDSAG